MNLRERILAQSKRKTVTVSPEFLQGSETETIELVEMTVGERSALVSATYEDGQLRDSAEYEAMVVIACARDPKTQANVFTTGDRDTLMSLPASVLDAIAAPALRINGLMIGGADVDTAVKNSDATPSSSLSSDSPNGSE